MRGRDTERGHARAAQEGARAAQGRGRKEQQERAGAAGRAAATRREGEAWGRGSGGAGEPGRGRRGCEAGPRALTPLEELGHILVPAQGRVAALGVQADEHVE